MEGMQIQGLLEYLGAGGDISLFFIAYFLLKHNNSIERLHNDIRRIETILHERRSGVKDVVAGVLKARDDLHR